MDKTDYLSPYIRVAMDSVIEPPWILSERVIFDYELLYIKGGDVLITVEDTLYEGSPGDIFLFKPKQRHSIKTIGNEPFHQPHLHFDLYTSPDSEEVKVSFRPLEALSLSELVLFREDDTGEGSLMALPSRITVGNIPLFEHLLFEVIRRHNALDMFTKIAEKSAFLELWGYILTENHKLQYPCIEQKYEDMKRVKEHIDSQTAENVTLDELARQFHLSKYYLLKLFKQIYGVTPVYYSRLVKIKKARELIQYSSLSITQIASNLGFGSVNAFTRAFLHVEGVSPSYYRSSKRP